MKLRTRSLALLLLLSMLIALFPSWSVTAATQESGALDTRTQKIVTVVYDTSYSMNPEYLESQGKSDEFRIEGAVYSLSVLAASLDERDEMYIVPMDNYNSEISVTLSSSDRNAEVQRILTKIPTDKSGYGSGTPIRSVHSAVNVLKKKGLNEDLKKMDSGKEYWLIILTDGAFDAAREDDESGQAKAIADAVKNYPTLRTAFVSFGSTATNISNEKVIKDNPKIAAYCNVTPKPEKGEQGLVDVISKIASDISGRYPLDSTLCKVDGNKVTVDISSIGFSLSSLSVVAQNCGAEIKNNGVSYSGSSSVSIANKCVITPHSKLGLKAGCTFKILASPSLLGGTLTLEFDGNVSKDDLVIYAEPALNITSYIEAEINGSWVRITPSEINATMDAGDMVRVGYEVNNGDVELEQYFDDVTTKVIYAGKEVDMDKEFALVEGTHDLSVEVSVLKGNYTLRDSKILTVEKDHRAFRVEPENGTSEVEGASPTAKATFTVFVKDQKATKAVLDNGYKLNLVITRQSTGEVISEGKPKIESDGTIIGSLQLETNDWDVFIFDLTVTSPEDNERYGKHTVTCVPSGFEVNVDGEKELSITQYDLIENKDGAALTFLLTANGKSFPFDNTVSTYKLTVGGIDVTEFAEVSGGTLTYVPKDAHLTKISGKPGTYDVVLTIDSKRDSLKTKNEEAKLTIIKTEFAVVPVDTANKRIDRFDLSHCDASLAFTVTRDGIPLTAQELEAVKDKLKVKTTPLFTFFLFPAGATNGIEEIDEGTGALVIKAKKDMPRYFEWHFAAFITGGNKNVTVTYGDVSATDHFEMIKSNPLVHIFRIFCLILAIAIAVYLSIYIAGFIVAKPLPYGIFIKSGVKGASEVTYINESVFTIVLWHLKRFISPTKLLKDQPIGDQAPWCDNMTFEHKKGKIEMTPAADNCIYKVDINPAHVNTMTQFTKACESGSERKLSDFMKDAKVKSADQIFNVALDNASIPMTAKKTMSKGAYYGCYSKKAKKLSMNYAVGFRPLSRNK